MTDLEGVKDIARQIRARFGSETVLRGGSDEQHDQIDNGWRVAIAPAPFHYEQTRVEA